MTLRLQCLCGAWIEAGEAAREPALCGGRGVSWVEHSHTSSEMKVVPVGPSRRRR